MFCANCGNKFINGDLFCTKCGQLAGSIDVNLTEEAIEVELETSVVEDATIPLEVLDPEAVVVSVEVTKESKGIRKWVVTGIVTLLLLIVGGGVFITQNMHYTEQNIQEDTLPMVADIPAATEVETTKGSELTSLERLVIDQIDQTAFPTIKLMINVSNANKTVYVAEDFTVTEDGVARQIDQIEYMANSNVLILTYLTNQIHRNPGNIDTRNVAITLLDKQSESSYEAPQPLSLRMGDISYNTDQYPDINVYFSLYDAYDKLVETLPSDASLFHVTEDGRTQPISEVAKMADAKESLSINVVMDNSNSMYDKIDLVKQEALQFLDHITMGPNDRIGFMSFAGASEIVQFDFTNNTSDVVPQVNALNADGNCTALYRAIEQAVYNTAYNGEKGSKYVVIFTDGEENCSNDSFENQDFLNPQTVINTANQLGIPIYAVGVDQDDQLKAITKETNGEYISIGSDIDRLGQFYQSIFTKKKAQYVVKYRSEIQQKAPRSTSISLLNERYFSKMDVAVTPRLIDDPGVARAMENYQMNWSASMSSGDISYLVPYVVYDNTSKTAVYKIVYDQLISLNDAKANGSETTFSVPVYKLLDANKVSESLYQLKVNKYFKRTIVNNGSVSSIRYKSTAYTYNVVKENGTWLVESTVETKVPEICYTDETYSKVTVCK